MKKCIFLIICAFVTTLVNCQKQEVIGTEKVLRINFLNPAIELEIPTGQYSTFSSAIGIGYGVDTRS